MFFLDRISFSSICFLLFTRRSKTIIVLDQIKLSALVLVFMRIINVKIKEFDFIAGELLDKNGESVYVSSIKISNRLAMKAANSVITDNKEFYRLNLEYGNNTIKLFMSKYFSRKINYFVLRCLVVQTLDIESKAKITLYIKNTDVFSSDLIDSEFPDVKIIYYSNYLTKYFDLFKYCLGIILRQFRLSLQHLTATYNLSTSDLSKLSVLSLSEDTIGSNTKFRNHPHWLDYDNVSSMYNNYVIDLNNVSKDYSLLCDANTYIIRPSLALRAIKECSENMHIKDLSKQMNMLLRNFVFEPNYVKKNMYILTYNLFRESRQISSLALYLNCKLFLYRSTHAIQSDAIQLISSRIDIKTMCTQYSNMSMMHPVMMSSADEYILFSDMYKNVFEYEDIKPKRFLSFGYLYNGIAVHVMKESELIRFNLISLGVRFVVGYFDESVQFDKWAFFTKRAHVHELNLLAKKVIEDPSFGVIVKSQFLYSTPSKLYPDNKYLFEAKLTGRFVELVQEGSVRNDIYPTQVALASDLCVSHKIGATAGLESALAGKRSLLINSPPMFGFTDHLYYRADIIYPNMEEVIHAIDAYRNGVSNKQNLGDWRDIIYNFDPYIDDKAVSRLRNHIENSLFNA